MRTNTQLKERLRPQTAKSKLVEKIAKPTNVEAKQESKIRQVKPLRITLENKSCFEFLKSIQTESVDLVLIDPPYEISRETGFQSCGEKGVERFSVSMDFGDWDKDFEGLVDVVNECYRVLRKGGTFICFYDLWKITDLKRMMETAKFKQIRFLEWVKTNPVPINSKVNYLTNSREVALLGVKQSKPTFNSEYDNGTYSYPICHEKGRFHPTQKPLKLISELIEKHSNPGDVVLDCFSGSGTTAHASICTNRNFLGCELSEDYFAKSIDRLNTAKDSSVILSTGK